MRPAIIANVQIAVVDHEPLTREFVANVMMYCVNREILVFADAQAVKDYLGAGRRIDVVITDLRLPGDKGVALLQYLTKEHSDIIVVTMSANPADETLARDFHADAFLAKPFALKDLFQIVQQFVVDGAVTDLP